MKKFVCAMMFSFMFVAIAFSVLPVKADTLDERVGALAVDTALSSFVDVLPSPEQVETLGGVQTWLGKVGQQFKEAWERDNRNWQNFVDSIDGLIDDSFGSVFEVADSVVKDVRDVVYNFYNLIFGIDEEISGCDTSNFGSDWDSNLNLASSVGRSAYVLMRNFSDSTALYLKSPLYTVSPILNFSGNQFTVSNAVYYPSGSYLLFDPPNKVSYICIYVGNVPTVIGDSRANVVFVQYGVPSETVSFVPKVDNQFFNNYYFGFGDVTTVSPSRIVNNYDTVYNYVTNNYYTDGVREIKDTPKGYYVSPVDTNGNGVSINGIGDITIDLPNADGFGNLFGNSDTSTVLALENSSWLKFLEFVPSEIMLMLFISIAVGCVCVVIKAVR